MSVNDNGFDHDDEDGDDAMDAVPASAVVAPVPAGRAPANGGVGAPAVAGYYVSVIRRFLREVSGVPEAIIDGGIWAGFVGYVQGRIA